MGPVSWGPEDMWPEGMWPAVCLVYCRDLPKPVKQWTAGSALWAVSTERKKTDCSVGLNIDWLLTIRLHSPGRTQPTAGDIRAARPTPWPSLFCIMFLLVVQMQLKNYRKHGIPFSVQRDCHADAATPQDPIIISSSTEAPIGSFVQRAAQKALA